ncbi:MAG: redox-sensing transcriptional repressor Rex [Oscillospiraceae bacterium]
MAKGQNVSLSVIKRLPRYHRYLGELLKNSITRISSRELAELMNLTASQIRQDLNCFGGFGQQGYGYNVSALYSEIGGILGLEKHLTTILIGAGNLGRTIATHLEFETMGFKLVGAFDSNYQNIPPVRGLKVQSPDNLEKFCNENSPSIAILCIPKEGAKYISDRLIECGVKGFWNFSHFEFGINRSDIVVENVHLADSMMTLCYRVNELETEMELKSLE